MLVDKKADILSFGVTMTLEYVGNLLGAGSLPSFSDLRIWMVQQCLQVHPFLQFIVPDASGLECKVL